MEQLEQAKQIALKFVSVRMRTEPGRRANAAEKRL